MTLKTKVKVGNITNLSDARYCAGMGVDMLGFAISDIEGQGIGAIKFKEITDWISGPQFILEIQNNLPGAAIIEKYSSELVEIPVSNISFLCNIEKDQFIIAIDLSEWSTYRIELLRSQHRIKYLHVTNSTGIDIRQIKHAVTEMSKDFSILLGLDIEVQLLDEYLSWPIAGIALSGSEEISPGMKDYDHLSTILEKLEVD